MKKPTQKLHISWATRLSKVQGSQEKRMSRIGDTANELRTQLTPQFAKRAGGAAGSASRQASTARGPEGFTIIELLMATAVFSLVLLAAIIGFIQVGSMFYKGIEVAKTQDTAGNILDSVTNDLHSLASGEFPSDPVALAGDNTKGYVCIGIHRYAFFLGQGSASTSLVDLSAPITSGTQVGLIRDDLSSKVGCPSLNDKPLSSNSQQLLGDGMVLGKFYINSVGSSGLYSIKIQVGFGDNANPGGVFDTSTVATDIPYPGAGNSGSPNLTYSLRCRGLLGTNFCSVTNIDTFVTKGLGL